METKYYPKILMKSLSHKWFNNDLDPTSAPKIQKFKLKVKKPRGNDIKWSNPYEDQTMKALMLQTFPVIIKK
jgi:hypothetical protein